MTLPTGCRPPDPPRRLAPVRSTRRHPPPGDHSATFPDPPTPLEARAAATFARAAQTTPLPKYAIDILAPMRLDRATQYPLDGDWSTASKPVVTGCSAFAEH